MSTKAINLSRFPVVLVMLTVILTLVNSTLMAQGKGKGGKNNPPPYAVVDLLGLPGGPGGGLQSNAEALNEPTLGSLSIVGDSHVGSELLPAVWTVESDGSFTIEELDVPLFTDYGTGINNAGVILVKSQMPSNDAPEGAQYVLVPTTSGYAKHELPTAGGVVAYGRAINKLGLIAGYIVFVNGEDRYGEGALWQLDGEGIPGQPLLLDQFEPYDISDTNIMVGNSFTQGAAIAWFDEYNDMQVNPLGTLPNYDRSRPRAISPSGEWIVGDAVQYIGSFQQEGFVWSLATGMQGIGRLGGNSSTGRGVNDTAQVVGWSDTGGGRHSQAAILWENGQLRDLNSLVDYKPHLELAKDINNNGNIVGIMKIWRPVSEVHGFLLIPNSQ